DSIKYAIGIIGNIHGSLRRYRHTCGPSKPGLSFKETREKIFSTYRFSVGKMYALHFETYRLAAVPRSMPRNDSVTAKRRRRREKLKGNWRHVSLELHCRRLRSFYPF